MFIRYLIKNTNTSQLLLYLAKICSAFLSKKKYKQDTTTHRSVHSQFRQQWDNGSSSPKDVILVDSSAAFQPFPVPVGDRDQINVQKRLDEMVKAWDKRILVQGAYDLCMCRCVSCSVYT